MRTVLKTRQIWTYDCWRCGERSAVEYEAWQTSHASGEVAAWRRGGLPSLAPWADPTCPQCGGTRVRLRPACTPPHDVPS